MPSYPTWKKIRLEYTGQQQNAKGWGRTYTRYVCNHDQETAFKNACYIDAFNATGDNNLQHYKEEYKKSTPSKPIDAKAI